MQYSMIRRNPHVFIRGDKELTNKFENMDGEYLMAYSHIVLFVESDYVSVVKNLFGYSIEEIMKIFVDLQKDS